MDVSDNLTGVSRQYFEFIVPRVAAFTRMSRFLLQ